MPRTLLLTTGTSIANGTALLPDFQKRATTWEDDTGGLRDQIRERLRGFDLATENGRVRASAELNILHRLPVRPDDEVVLFSTDTADGRSCSEALVEVVREVFGVGKVVVERIKGLQVRDADILRRVGLTNLMRRLIHYLDDPQRRYGGGCVLCPNGGFKGIVPFMTVLGMIYRAPVVYVFEFAETVITLPPLPIGFATDLIERALPALRWASSEGVFPQDSFFRLIPGYAEGEEQVFGSFLEIVPEAGGGSLATLSPLASALAEKEALADGHLLLSERADKVIGSLRGTDLRDVNLQLQKLVSPLWRAQHLDTKYGSDLEFYPRGHYPWRFAGYVVGGVFRLCWFARHDEYERFIPQPSSHRSAFESDTFSEFRPAVVEEPELPPENSDRNATWQDMRDQRDLARTEAQVLRTETSILRDEHVELKLAHGKALQTIAEFKRKSKSKAADKSGIKSKVTPPEPDLRGRILNVRCEEVRKQSLLLSAVDQPEALQILIPSRDVPDIRQGDVTTVEVTGFDGNYYQARPLHRPPPSEA